MQADFIIKLAALFLTNFGIGITLIVAINKDEFKSPLKWSSVILSLSTIITSIFLWMASAHYFILGLIANNLVSFTLIYWLVKNRDVGGINLAERTLVYFTSLDTQLCFLLNGISQNRDPEELSQYIGVALGTAITAISNIIGLNGSHDSHISIFRAIDGKFKVLASCGVTPEYVESIQDKFCYISKPYGLAGYTIFEGKTISIADLKNTKDPNFNKWVPIFEGQTRSGSIICLPILRGFKGEDKTKPMGVLNLTSKRKKVFDSASIRSLLNRFANKIEILLYCLELVGNRTKTN
jgi:hypothetical protein